MGAMEIVVTPPHSPSRTPLESPGGETVVLNRAWAADLNQNKRKRDKNDDDIDNERVKRQKLEEENKTLKEDHQKALAEIDRLQKQKEDANEKMKKLRKHNDRLVNQYRQDQAEIDELKKTRLENDNNNNHVQLTEQGIYDMQLVEQGRHVDIRQGISAINPLADCFNLVRGGWFHREM